MCVGMRGTEEEEEEEEEEDDEQGRAGDVCKSRPVFRRHFA